MTTNGVPQRGKHGRFGSGMERLLLAIPIVLLIIVVVLSIWQIRKTWFTPALPTLIPQATLPDMAPEPVVQLMPDAGGKGTLVIVRGQGWQPDHHLIVCLDDLGDDAEPPIYAETVVNADGEFFTAFTFPTDVQWRSLPEIPVVVESKTNHEKRSAVFRLITDTPTPMVPTAIPLPQTPTAVPATATPACTYNMRFVADISIPDDTVIPPGVSFVKTWRIGNNGSCPWPAGTNWVFAGGSRMGGPNTVSIPVTHPGEETDVSVRLVAPARPGRYTGYWTLRLPDGTTFSQRYFVRIVVPTPTSTPRPATPTSTAVPPTPTTVPPTSTPIIFNWRGEYFSNSTLAGSPVLVRDDTAVHFNWGSDAPATNLPSDNFSARWTRSVSLAEGTYRFHAAMDDGLRLYVDDHLLINEWRDASYRSVSADIWLAAGSHLLRVEYYEHLGQARVQLQWEPIAGFPNWRGEYWDNKDLSGSPLLVRNDAQIDFDWGFAAPASGLPEDGFSARWTRTVTFEPGTYRFSARADDGVRVTVDGERIIDQWHLSGADRTYQAEMTLQGEHTLVVTYYEEQFTAVVHFWYERIDN